jgi:hypothetical protein
MKERGVLFQQAGKQAEVASLCRVKERGRLLLFLCHSLLLRLTNSKRSNAAHNAPAHKIDEFNSLRVGGRVHALVRPRRWSW